MNFINELQTSTNKNARTENGALSNTSTLDPVLDFFSKAGAMRGRESEAFGLFQKAFDADPQSAIRVLFYLRDIRGGQGERSVFRYILNQLDPDFVNKLIQYIPEYGRWDEVPLTPAGISFIRRQLALDSLALGKGESVSLLAKWLPSEKTSSAATRQKALKLAKELDWTPARYRKTVSALRKQIKLLEQQMSAKKWDDIEFDKIPSQAHKKHTKAFYRHNEERYKSYLESVQKGEKKINSGTLFAYQLYDMVMRGSAQDEKAADALWANLPDYTRGDNALVLADVSASMGGFPMSVSVSLALYFAERNKGPFKDYFMTFTSQSRLQKVSGDTLSAKMRSIQSADWHGSTNLQSAFDAILKAARDSHASEDEMPKILYIISDMQFDLATGGGYYNQSVTNFEEAKRKYAAAGYSLPHVVFWNANAYGNDAPATKYDGNVTLISGSNQSAFQYAVQGKTPMESMLDILNSDRYNKIVL